MFQALVDIVMWKQQYCHLVRDMALKQKRMPRVIFAITTTMLQDTVPFLSSILNATDTIIFVTESLKNQAHVEYVQTMKAHVMEALLKQVQIFLALYFVSPLSRTT